MFLEIGHHILWATGKVTPNTKFYLFFFHLQIPIIPLNLSFRFIILKTNIINSEHIILYENTFMFSNGLAYEQAIEVIKTSTYTKKG